MPAEYTWTDNPTVNGVANCDTDVLNDCLMHLKYTKTMRNTGSTEKSLIPLEDADIHLYDGSLLSGEGVYADFVDFIVAKYEEDEKNWEINVAEPQQNLPDNYYWTSIIFVNSQYYVYGVSLSGQSGLYVSTSADLITWTTPTLIFASFSLCSNVVFGNGKFVMFGRYNTSNNLYVSTSADGVSWNTPTSLNIGDFVGPGTWYIACGQNKFIALSANNDRWTYSTDGTNWAQLSTKSNSMTVSGLVFFNDKFIAYNTDGYIQYSESGFGDFSVPVQNNNLGINNWRVFAVDDKLKKVFALGGSNIAGAVSTIVSISASGLTWANAEEKDISSGYNWRSATYNNKNFVAIDSDKRAITTIELTYKGLFVTEEEWQESVNFTGQCAKFVWDSENDTLRLPKLDEKINDMFYSPINNYVVVGTSVKQDLEVNLDKVATDLNGKADRDLSNVSNKSGFRKLIGIYNDGFDWYKVYSEYNLTTGEIIGKWCEQGGFLDTQSTTNNISLLKPYASSTYQISLTNKYNANANAPCVVTQSVDSFQVYVSAVGYDVYWEAKGYIS